MIAKIDTLNKKFGKRFRLFVILILAVFMGYWLFFVRDTHHDEYHVHAGFKVFVDDKLIDFSDIKYMYYLPCGLDAADQKTLQDRVHLHDGIGDVVHVHAQGIRWKDLFESIKYELPISEDIEYFIGGEKVENLLEREIMNDESVLIVVNGTKPETEYLNEQVRIEKIREVASLKENCGD